MRLYSACGTICLLICLKSSLVTCAVTAQDMRAHLSTILPANYTTYIRPILNQNDPVKVTMDLHLIGINSFDNREQKLTTTAYLNVEWTDQVIADSWIDTDINHVYVPQGNVWRPDLALQNGFDTMVGLGSSFLYVRVDRNGLVTWRPYQVFESGCEVNVRFFPFDKTSCELKFLVWSNTLDKVSVARGTVGFDTTLFEANSEWTVLQTSVSEFNAGDNSGILFKIEMERKPLHYLVTILVPVILLGALNAFLFVLPADSGEKTGYAVTAFLSFAVFLTIVGDEIPENSDKASMFSLYIFIMTMVSTLLVGVTIFQLRIHHRTDDHVPSRFLTRFTRLVRKVRCACCVGRNPKGREGPEVEEITWESITEAIDFAGFFFVMLFMLIFTMAIVVASTVGTQVPN
ncbi:hypothetical protein DPMN_165973 [Dreissena polymorpha]|uniref:Uncharacterized protein n=2 Tax=Dreissena polymorpha TaxID=45954 RepID=A0A9D4EYM1_DREPO|nr:hypothetical protein DPMN_165973 [Dreissena polymorpha]